jgi:hypothetical protein
VSYAPTYIRLIERDEKRVKDFRLHEAWMRPRDSEIVAQGTRSDGTEVVRVYHRSYAIVGEGEVVPLFVPGVVLVNVPVKQPRAMIVGSE